MIEVRDKSDVFVEIHVPGVATYKVSRAAARRITGDDQQPALPEGEVAAYLDSLPLGRAPQPEVAGSAFVYSKASV
jgi:hypothetical protein